METQTQDNISFIDFKKQILSDYKLIVKSREASIIARKEVLTGKAKFGIVGDGKELPQLAMAKVFRNGDFRSGYYRDQTFAFASKMVNFEQFFAQLYADADFEREPHSAGRQMNCHFSTRSLDENGNWKNIAQQKNSSADISPTAGQMPRLLGLAQASTLYKNVVELNEKKHFSNGGNEIAFGTIGDASTAEGHFWETINAACTLQVPMLLSIWDDGYGISVSNEYQRSKSDLFDLLEGFRRTETEKGAELIQVHAWDYPALIDAYEKAEEICRTQHVPVIVHVIECTQPQGHSTSGSHERYKSPERLAWEKEYDCNTKFREWILDFEISDDTTKLATEEELLEIENEAKQEVKTSQKLAWKEYQDSIKKYYDEVNPILSQIIEESANSNFIKPLKNLLENPSLFSKKHIFSIIRKIIWQLRNENIHTKNTLINWFSEQYKNEKSLYSSHLYSQSKWKATTIEEIKPILTDEEVDGRIVLRNNFEKIFDKYPEALIFGEDVGKIGDVNQGLEGLQAKFGKLRISDTGIRENTIVGQGIGMAMRGLRPIAEIQYLDYIFYAIQTLSDDLATLHYRSAGGQKAPLIVRTRGHRLEGIWHAGSPLGAILNMLKGVLVLVPRDLTKAAGFYNTMLQSDEPSLIIESLNGYRLKEKMPKNLGEFTTPVGKIEITEYGTDITIITYGSTWKIVMQAAQELKTLGISVEVIDAQSLMPFDIEQECVQSLQKTNRLLIVDEDVPGGGSAYILQEILEKQGGYKYLDSAPQTLTASEHRTAFASDGDYFSKPSVEDVVEKVYAIMHESNPNLFKPLF